MSRNAKLKYLALGLVFYTACKDSTPPKPPAEGPKLVEVNPSAHSAMAGVAVTGIQVKYTDAGAPVAGTVVTFAISGGNGTLSGQLVDTTDANGIASAPSWTMGTRANGAGGQILHVTATTATPLDIFATVVTNFKVEVKFFDNSMTPAQQAVFTNAAQRIQGIITGDMPDVQASNLDVSSSCASGAPNLTQLIDDIVIYARTKAIDGPGGAGGNILGTARPCFVRTTGATCGVGCQNIPIIGLMEFDTFDIAAMQADGTLQDVITHEMLHVIGVGSMWTTFGLLSGEGGADPRFTGAQGAVGCRDTGGIASCAVDVPVENQGGAGTRDSHWREATFGTELMTGTISGTPNPLSLVTIKSLADFGYVVNANAADTYTIASGAVKAPAALIAPGSPRAPVTRGKWELLNDGPLFGISLDGKTVRQIKAAP